MVDGRVVIGVIVVGSFLAVFLFSFLPLLILRRIFSKVGLGAKNALTVMLSVIFVAAAAFAYLFDNSIPFIEEDIVEFVIVPLLVNLLLGTLLISQKYISKTKLYIILYILCVLTALWMMFR